MPSNSSKIASASGSKAERSKSGALSSSSSRSWDYSVLVDIGCIVYPMFAVIDRVPVLLRHLRENFPPFLFGRFFVFFGRVRFRGRGNGFCSSAAEPVSSISKRDILRRFLFRRKGNGRGRGLTNDFFRTVFRAVFTEQSSFNRVFFKVMDSPAEYDVIVETGRRTRLFRLAFSLRRRRISESRPASFYSAAFCRPSECARRCLSFRIRISIEAFSSRYALIRCCSLVVAFKLSFIASLLKMAYRLKVLRFGVKFFQRRIVVEAAAIIRFVFRRADQDMVVPFAHKIPNVGDGNVNALIFRTS